MKRKLYIILYVLSETSTATAKKLLLKIEKYNE
jgi:hypothetical protein